VEVGDFGAGLLMAMCRAYASRARVREAVAAVITNYSMEDDMTDETFPPQTREAAREMLREHITSAI
jgi:hypothetical protein